MLVYRWTCSVLWYIAPLKLFVMMFSIHLIHDLKWNVLCLSFYCSNSWNLDAVLHFLPTATIFCTWFWQCFCWILRSNHPHFVFAAMETIMTLVIDESEDVSWDLLRILLASVRKENQVIVLSHFFPPFLIVSLVLWYLINLVSLSFQDVSPTSWKLGEKVFTKCAAKLKTNLKEAVQSRGIALDDYAEIVACICGSDDENPQHGHLIGSENQLVC